MEKQFNMYDYVIDLFCKIGSSAYGLAFALAMACVNFIAPEAFAFAIVLVAVFVDAVFGLIVAHKQKVFILSKLGRRTFVKIISYFSALLLIYMVEKLVHDEGFIGVKIASAWAVACEFWSFSAHVLILSPNAVFFRLARTQLRGEMEKKIGRNLDVELGNSEYRTPDWHNQRNPTPSRSNHDHPIAFDVYTHTDTAVDTSSACDAGSVDCGCD